MKFTKMHGLGNCYVYVNLFEEPLEEEDLPAVARLVSDVHFGIGSDGLITIGPSRTADFRMRIFNRDGSEGESCGNGLRCVAKYAYDRGLTDKTAFSVETGGGLARVKLWVEAGETKAVTVDMGEPRLAKRLVPMRGDPDSHTIDEPVDIPGTCGPDGRPWRMTVLSMGNPHAVIFVDDPAAVPLEQVGPVIERAPVFPERINVEFVAVHSRREIDFRVWERGSGATLACGTGACAAVAAGVLNGRLDRGVPVTVHLPGGDLEIVWHENGRILMTGPAAFVCDGVFYRPAERTDWRSGS